MCVVAVMLQGAIGDIAARFALLEDDKIVRQLTVKQNISTAALGNDFEGCGNGVEGYVRQW